MEEENKATPIKIISHMESKYDKFHIAPVEIMKYFDITKDAKFSLRTLLLLSIFTIVLFTFGINPEIGGISIKQKDLQVFSVFMLFVIVGQSIIAWCSYKLYKSHIDNFTTHLKNEIIRIKEVLKGIPTRKDLTEEKKITHKDFMEAKLSNHENIKKYSGIFYKWLTCWGTFIIAGIALASILCIWITGQNIIYWIICFFNWSICLFK